MQPLDWLVMAVYGAVVLGIGWAANRRQATSEDYFVGGRGLRWWVVGVSLVATSFSSVSLIGGTGFGYANGMAWLQLQVGDLVAISVVAAVFLPFFSGLKVTTAYEYLDRRFGRGARQVAAALFLVQTVLRSSLLILAPALALSAMLGWSVEVAIAVSASAAVLYSMFGGISAVVWTDLVQMGVIVLAVGYCVVLAVGDVPGGLAAVLDHGREAGRTEWITWEADRSTPFNVLGAVLPYGVLALSLFGTGQQAVQRFVSCKDLRSARKAAFTGWAVGTVALGSTLFLGVCLRGWVDLAPGAAALGVDSVGGLVSDRVLPDFVLARLPAGMAGLVLAAVFAASMSSLDSAVHSMSTSTVVDFLRPWRGAGRRLSNELRTARICTAVFGVVATVGALYAAHGRAGLLETLVTWLGYFAGPLLGLFLLGMTTRRANQHGALFGVALAFASIAAVVMFADDKPWGFHPLWLAPASCFVTFTVGYLAGFGADPPHDEQLDGLTVYTVHRK